MQTISIIVKAAGENMFEIAGPYDEVTHYGLADGVAVLTFADGAKLKVEGAVGFVSPMRGATDE